VDVPGASSKSAIAAGDLHRFEVVEKKNNGASVPSTLDLKFLDNASYDVR
jgi:hypothetical protein